MLCALRVLVPRRLVSPLVLRDFLLWLGTQGTDHAESLGRGFGLAVALGACAFLVGSIQHQQQWYGTLIGECRGPRRRSGFCACCSTLANFCAAFALALGAGFLMRQTMIATLHKKLMRLSSSAISPGKVINLCANDVRRFEDSECGGDLRSPWARIKRRAKNQPAASPPRPVPSPPSAASLYWIWSWIGPLELALVVVMISLELDFVSAIAGASAIIALIPLQVRTHAGGVRCASVRWWRRAATERARRCRGQWAKAQAHGRGAPAPA